MTAPRRLLFWMGPILILALGALFLHFRWNSIPERFATHWNANGEADGWATRSGSYAPFTSGAVEISVSTIVAFLFLRKGRTDSVKRWVPPVLLAFAYVMSINFVIVGTLPLWSDGSDDLSPVLVILPVLSIVAMLAVISVLYVREQRHL